MIIANPLCDTTFQYLMEDMTCVRIFLETIIEKEIEQVERVFDQRTCTEKELSEMKRAHRVIHFDFVIVIKTPSGERRRVLMEVLKGDDPSGIIRYRRYLDAYRNVVPLLNTLSVYMLGFALENMENVATHVVSQYISAETGEPIAGQSPMLELLLGYDYYVLQAPREPRTDEISRPITDLMELFNQSYRLETDPNHLKLPRETFDDRIGILVERLRKAPL